MKWKIGLPVILALAIVAGLLYKSGLSRTAVADASEAGSTATAEATAEAPAEDPATKAADDAVKKLIPANVDQTEVDRFYAEHKDGLLMANTWPGLAEERKDNTAVLLENGLFGAVEFPVDIVLKSKSSNYALDHEGAYTEDELKAIKAWIEEQLKSDKLTDDEKHLILDWVVERIARDPIYGNMWAQAFASLHSQSGKSVRGLFPWLDEFLKDWEEGNRLEAYSCKYEGDDKIYVSPEYKEIGFRLATTFVRLTVVEISKPTAEHWYMGEMSQLPSETMTVKAPYHESEAAAVFAAYDKGNGGKAQEVFKERLALNLNDGRAEILVKEQPKPVTPAPAPTPTPTPTSTPTPGASQRFPRGS